MSDESTPNHTEEDLEGEGPLKNDTTSSNENTTTTLSIRESFVTLLLRPVLSSCYYSMSGMVGASLVGPYGGFLFRWTLHAQAILVLGPTGAAQGLVQASREIVLNSGVAARLGQQVYQQALQLVQDDEHESKNVKQALEHLRESYPMAKSILTGDGVLGYLTQTVLGLFLPNIGEIFNQVEKAVEWSEEHEEELADTEIVARVTTEYIDAYLNEKERFITTAGTILHSAIAGVSFVVSVAIGSLFE